MVNKVTLVGHLGRDPEIRTLENGTKVGTFSLATNETFKDKTDNWQTVTEWHNIVVWRGLAEKAERDLKKGNLAFIEGKITHRKYNDKDGVERSTTDIVANQLYSLERREKSGSSFDTGFPSLDDEPVNNRNISAGGNSNPDLSGTPIDDLPF